MSDEPDPSISYKEFEIDPIPYQLTDTGEWKVHIQILRHTEEKTNIRPFTAGGSCPSKEAAIQLCYDFGKKIIDGEVPGQTIKGM